MKAQPVADPNLGRRKVESLTAELLNTYEELYLLYSLSSRFAGLRHEYQIAFAALEEAVEVLHAECGWVILREGGSLHIPDGSRIAISAATAEEITRIVFPPQRNTPEQELSHSLRREWGIDAPGAPARLLGCALRGSGLVEGHICLGREEDSRIFNSADQKLLHAVASITGLALHNVRLQRSELERQRLETELELARQIQQSLLPRDFACCDFVTASGVSLPCYEIGGDYFDIFALNKNSCLIGIADVSGKGPAAALQAAIVQGVLQGVARHSSQLPRLVETLNDCLRSRATEGSFVTAFLATIDETGILRYTNGGHNPPLWIRKNGEIEILSEGGPLLGIFETVRVPETSAQLSPGDLVVLYTDGVTDCLNANDESFGDERLIAWARQQHGKSAVEVQESLVRTTVEFCEGQRQPDDLTVLVVRFEQF